MMLQELKLTMLAANYSPLVENALRHLDNPQLWKLDLQGKMKDWLAAELSKLPPNTEPGDLKPMLFKKRFGYLLRIVGDIQFHGADAKGHFLQWSVLVMTHREWESLQRAAKKAGLSRAAQPR